MSLRRSCLAALLLAALSLAEHAAAASPADRCHAGKLKAAARQGACLLNAQARFVLGRPADLERCDAKFADRFTDLEGKADGECVTSGDAEAIGAVIEAAAIGIGRALSGDRFFDNGDGTVTDALTGLMWEQKDESGGIHDKDASFTWTGAMSDWLSELNGHSDGTNPKAPGFAGHDDWRLPTVDELQTILLAPDPCGTVPCIDPVFGPTSADTTLTSTTLATSPGDVWSVNFNDGHLSNPPKGNFNRVRAVRRAF
jgi:hypothetical protein